MWAACRGQGPAEWTVLRDDPAETAAKKLRRLRAVCRTCPVAGSCLRDAMNEPSYELALGPVRAGVSGGSWRAVTAMMTDLDPVSAEDWTAAARLLLDLDRLPSGRRSAA
jgi:hypothetical protein